MTKGIRRGMLLFRDAKEGKGSERKEEQEEARGGQVAREDKTGVQTPGRAIWRWAQR